MLLVGVRAELGMWGGWCELRSCGNLVRGLFTLSLNLSHRLVVRFPLLWPLDLGYPGDNSEGRKLGVLRTVYVVFIAWQILVLECSLVVIFFFLSPTQLAQSITAFPPTSLLLDSPVISLISHPPLHSNLWILGHQQRPRLLLALALVPPVKDNPLPPQNALQNQKNLIVSIVLPSSQCSHMSAIWSRSRDTSRLHSSSACGSSLRHGARLYAASASTRASTNAARSCIRPFLMWPCLFLRAPRCWRFGRPEHRGRHALGKGSEGRGCAAMARLGVAGDAKWMGWRRQGGRG